jgi:hypothetical protein
MLNQVSKEMLIVKPGQNMNMLRGQAMDIRGWALSTEGSVSVMMHTPSEAQEADVVQLENKSGKKIALIGGQFGLMHNVLNQLQDKFLVVEAISDRVSEEQIQPDGSTKKVSVFKYLGLRVLGGGSND